MEQNWITGHSPLIEHVNMIGAGGYGEVHEVALLHSKDRLIN